MRVFFLILIAVLSMGATTAPIQQSDFDIPEGEDEAMPETVRIAFIWGGQIYAVHIATPAPNMLPLDWSLPIKPGIELRADDFLKMTMVNTRKDKQLAYGYLSGCPTARGEPVTKMFIRWPELKPRQREQRIQRLCW